MIDELGLLEVVQRLAPWEQCGMETEVVTGREANIVSVWIVNSMRNGTVQMSRIDSVSALDCELLRD